MERRNFVKTVLAGSVIPVAGCLSGEEEPDEDDTQEEGTDDAQQGVEDTQEGADDTQEPSDDDDEEPPRSDDDELLSITELEDRDFFDGGAETFEGSGQTVTDEFSLGGALTTFVFDHDGETNFIIELAGEAEDILVNEIGPVSGAVAFAAPMGEYQMDIDADGDWTVHVSQPLAPPEEVRTPPVSASGDGPDVVGPVELSETTTFTGEHEGDENFQVIVYNEDANNQMPDEIVFNEIGSFSGEALVDAVGGLDNVAWIEVMADGDWNLSIE